MFLLILKILVRRRAWRSQMRNFALKSLKWLISTIRTSRFSTTKAVMTARTTKSKSRSLDLWNRTLNRLSLTRNTEISWMSTSTTDLLFTRSVHQGGTADLLILQHHRRITQWDLAVVIKCAWSVRSASSRTSRSCNLTVCIFTTSTAQNDGLLTTAIIAPCAERLL